MFRGRISKTLQYSLPSVFTFPSVSLSSLDDVRCPVTKEEKRRGVVPVSMVTLNTQPSGHTHSMLHPTRGNFIGRYFFLL